MTYNWNLDQLILSIIHLINLHTDGDDETAGSTAAQAGGVCHRLGKATMLLLEDDHSTPKHANDPEAEVDTYIRDNQSVVCNTCTVHLRN